MLAAERHRTILDLAQRDGTVRTASLARDFKVAEETIRRDLEHLAHRGLLRRTHGGAMNPSLPAGESAHQEREQRQAAEKRAIARRAAKLITDGETLLLDASSTALELTGFLPGGVRVVTYSLAVVERLSRRDDLELIQLGGTYESRGRRFAGMLTESALLSLRIDRFFFSGGGFDPELGVSEPNPDQARLKSLALRHAGHACALIDHTKLGRRDDHFFARPDTFHTLVTDSAARPFFRGRTRSLSFKLHYA